MSGVGAVDGIVVDQARAEELAEQALRSAEAAKKKSAEVEAERRRLRSRAYDIDRSVAVGGVSNDLRPEFSNLRMECELFEEDNDLRGCLTKSDVFQRLVEAFRPTAPASEGPAKRASEGIAESPQPAKLHKKSAATEVVAFSTLFEHSSSLGSSVVAVRY